MQEQCLNGRSIATMNLMFLTIYISWSFINLIRAQASEISVHLEGHKKASGSGRGFNPSRPITSFTANTGSNVCVLCKPSKHPLYSCPKFKSMSVNERQAIVKSNNLCMNCLRSDHYSQNCKSSHRCRDCQKPHHSLLHFNSKNDTGGAAPAQTAMTVQSNTATLKTSSLLMTCQVMIISPNGSSTKARALLDSGSSASFVSERMARSLHLPHSRQSTQIFGIAGLCHGSPSHFVTNFCISPCNNFDKSFDVSAVVIPRVTCNVPAHPIPVDCT